MDPAWDGSRDGADEGIKRQKNWTKAEIGGTVSQVLAKAKSSTLVRGP